MGIDLVYLILLITGVIVLSENRIHIVLFALAFQGLLLVICIFHVHPINQLESWILAILAITFKSILTPYILSWTIRRLKLPESTSSRFGFLPVLFLLLIGIFACVVISKNIKGLPEGTHQIGFIYILLLIYVGVLTFIVRKNWIALVSGFIVFENGSFLLTLLLNHGLPLGVELGTFMDAVLVIVSAVVVRVQVDVKEQRSNYGV